jgi:hypothetical protein
VRRPSFENSTEKLTHMQLVIPFSQVNVNSRPWQPASERITIEYTGKSASLKIATGESNHP